MGLADWLLGSSNASGYKDVAGNVYSTYEDAVKSSENLTFGTDIYKDMALATPIEGGSSEGLFSKGGMFGKEGMFGEGGAGRNAISTGLAGIEAYSALDDLFGQGASNKEDAIERQKKAFNQQYNMNDALFRDYRQDRTTMLNNRKKLDAQFDNGGVS